MVEVEIDGRSGRLQAHTGIIAKSGHQSHTKKNHQKSQISVKVYEEAKPIRLAAAAPLEVANINSSGACKDQHIVQFFESKLQCTDEEEISVVHARE